MGLEYLLAAGGVVAVIIAALILGFEALVPQVVGQPCPVVDPLGSNVAGDCLSVDTPP